jgi:uncharacterized protein
MIAVDTNILVHAHRSDAANHARCLACLKHLAENISPWGLPVFCIAEFARIAWLRQLLLSPSVRILNPEDDFLAIFLQEIQAADTRGNLVFDAQIAAVCLEHGVDRLLTLDRDFARFSRLTPLGLDQFAI